MSLARNVIYMLAGRWVYNLTTLVTFSIIVAMIRPSDFGIYTLASTFSIFSDTFFSDGVENLILKRKKLTIQVKSSLFWVTLAMSCGLAVFVTLISFPIGWLYQSPRLISAIQAMALVLLIQGAASVPRALLLNMGRSRHYATNSAVSNIAGSAFGILAAVEGAGIWALIVQPLILQTSMLVLCSLAASFRPSFTLDRDMAREFVFDLLVMLWSTFLNILGNRIDVFMVGYVFGEAMTGIYGLAKRLVQILQDLVASSFDKILLSMLSGGQSEDSDKLYRSSVFLQALVAIPSFAGFAAVSPLLIPTIFGSEWRSAGALLPLMAAGGVFRSMVTIERAKQMAHGQIKQIAQVRLVELLIGVALAPATWLGLSVVALTFSLRNFVGYMLVLISRFGWLSLWRHLALIGRLLSWPIFASVLMAGAVLWTIAAFGNAMHPWIIIAACVLNGLVSFAATMALLRRFWLPYLKAQ